jgi:hypothetical protein
VGDGEQQPSAVFMTEEETEIHQHRDQIHNLRRKIERTYYQAIQIAIDNRPRYKINHKVHAIHN